MLEEAIQLRLEARHLQVIGYKGCFNEATNTFLPWAVGGGTVSVFALQRLNFTLKKVMIGKEVLEVLKLARGEFR